MREEKIQIPLEAGHDRPASEMAFHWRADDRPTLNAGLAALCFISGSGPVLLINTIVCDFQGGRDPLPPSGSAHAFPRIPSWDRIILDIFYRRPYDLISKFQVGLKSLLRQGLSEPDFYGDLVYKLKKIVGSNNFSAQFIKIISHYKKIGYNINVLQQTACLVVSPITVGSFAFLFNCTPVGRTSDSMMVPTSRHLLMRW